MMQLTIQLVASAMIVVAVLWWMWRMPGGDALYGWGSPLALFSVWIGLAAIVCTAALWFVTFADGWLVIIFLVMDPAALTAGVLVLWIFRGYKPLPTTDDALDCVQLQRQQAWVGIILSLAAVAAGYVYVMMHKSPFTPVGV